MHRIPLFPLHVVLFPTGAIPLHIFEPRYQEMVEDVMAGDGRFGMIYHDPDQHGPFLAEEGRVGCIAEIREHQELVEDRSLILAVGVERFQISEYVESDRKYYEAIVEPYGDWELSSPRLHDRRHQVIDLFEEVVSSAAAEAEEELPEIDAGYDVSFPMAAMIQVDQEWQQNLLELRREPERLDQLEALMRLALGGGPTG